MLPPPARCLFRRIGSICSCSLGIRPASPFHKSNNGISAYCRAYGKSMRYRNAGILRHVRNPCKERKSNTRGGSARGQSVPFSLNNLLFYPSIPLKTSSDFLHEVHLAYRQSRHRASLSHLSVLKAKAAGRHLFALVQKIPTSVSRFPI